MKPHQFEGHGLLVCILCVLAGCGGAVTDVPASIGPDSAPVAGTVMKGVYGASLENKEFVSVVTPKLDWYALYFERLTHTNPDLYSGRIDLGVNGSATISSLHAFQIAKSALPLAGNASISAASPESYKLSVSGITSALGNSLSFAAAALGLSIYNPAKAASSDDFQGAPAWQGSWYDGDTSNLSQLEFSATGAVSTVAALNYCNLSSLALKPMSEVNLFKVSLNIPMKGSGGICLRATDHLSGIDFSGVAFIYKSPLPGKNWRLDLIAVDGAGSGISFRGDR